MYCYYAGYYRIVVCFTQIIGISKYFNTFNILFLFLHIIADKIRQKNEDKQNILIFSSFILLFPESI